MATLGYFDGFGSSVSLNASGDRLAVGAVGDAGARNDTLGAGAVRLFAFADRHFRGGVLASTIGKGYGGGGNIGVAGLGKFDRFGFSVSLNGSGDRLAVGAPGDDGARNGTPGAGAAYLFAFATRSLEGGALASTVGKGYAVAVPALGILDEFGASVSLNSSGSRLAVGAPGDDGAGGGAPNAGAAYLFVFDGSAFRDGALASIVGVGYAGGGDGAAEAPAPGSRIGGAVALDGAGRRLFAGSVGDARGEAGVMHLSSH